MTTGKSLMSDTPGAIRIQPDWINVEEIGEVDLHGRLLAIFDRRPTV